ncbi:choice-of-anchor M domain-containing protein [Corynebacterium sp. LK2510]|uniref:choice-of-anchor M domain-containing protein n=1 Tax=Corynebacterium sp. LK2510 TaxID=3110472 RepID=UPI0034CEE09F
MKRLLVLLTASAFGAAPLLDAPLALAETATETAPETSTCSALSVEVDHIIRDGHQDLRISPTGSIVVRDGDDDYESGSVAFAVPDSARTSFDIPGFSDDGFFLDQTQDYTMPWFGFSTEDTTESVRISLESVTGPGRIVAWHSLMSQELDFLLDSADPRTTYLLPARSHDHVNWAFSEPGSYAATFLVETGSTRETYDVVFLVGDEAIAEADTGTVEVNCEVSPPVASGEVNPRQLATDITRLTKEFTALDKAWGTFTKQMEKDLAAQSETPKERTPSSDKSPATKKGSEKTSDKAGPAKSRTAKPGTRESNSAQSNSARSNAGQSGAASQKKASGGQQSSRAATGSKEKSNTGTAAKRDSTSKAAKAKQRHDSAAQASEGAIPDADETSANASSSPDDGSGNPSLQGDEATLAQQSWQKAGWWPGAVAGAGVTALLAGLLLLVAAQRITSGGAV